jgi:iron(III) transport system substrate-binding protein
MPNRQPRKWPLWFESLNTNGKSQLDSTDPPVAPRFLKGRWRVFQQSAGQLRQVLFFSLLLLGTTLLPLNSVRGQSEDELVRGAKKESKVVFWSSMRIEDSRALAAGFETRYPFIKVDIFRAGGEQIVNRALAEHMAGKTTYDVLNAFALKVVQNRGLLQAYAAPEATHYPTGFKDPQNCWVSLYSGYNVIGYNTKLVAKADAPKNWDDLLHPRWKGKLGMDDEEYFWHAGMLKHWGEEKGRKYMEALSRQGLQFRNGHALLADLMSAGEFPTAVVVYPDHIEQMKNKGQPVEWVKSTDPMLVNLAPVAVAAKAPQPNAAKLFMNYSISKEGQEILRKARRASARHDVPPIVPDMDPRKLKLVPLDPDIATNAEHIKEFRRAFGLN